MLVALGAAPVVAQRGAGPSAVDRGWQLMLEADFDGALSAFDEAEHGTLSRAELVRTLEGRAHALFALGREDALRAALVRLAATAPEHRLAPETPPELRERFEQHAGASRLELHVTMEEQPGEARLEASATGDPGGLVRHLLVAARVGDGEWVEAEDEPLTVPTDPASALAWYGLAIGPGGAIVASDGTREAPHLRAGATSDGGDVPWLWIGVGGGIAVVLGIVITVAVVATLPADTQPGAPVFP